MRHLGGEARDQRFLALLRLRQRIGDQVTAAKRVHRDKPPQWCVDVQRQMRSHHPREVKRGVEAGVRAGRAIGIDKERTHRAILSGDGVDGVFCG
ncbi:MAG: hypothetical protein C0476_10550 [Sphingomonas sp.]|nr:hypothetical protein [Sphingomonas sp.]